MVQLSIRSKVPLDLSPAVIEEKERTMKVHYSTNNTSHSFDLPELDDLREIIPAIEQHLLSEHPELGTNHRLPILVSDGVLDCLAEEQEEITLGELVH